MARRRRKGRSNRKSRTYLSNRTRRGRRIQKYGSSRGGIRM